MQNNFSKFIDCSNGRLSRLEVLASNFLIHIEAEVTTLKLITQVSLYSEALRNRVS